MTQQIAHLLREEAWRLVALALVVLAFLACPGCGDWFDREQGETMRLSDYRLQGRRARVQRGAGQSSRVVETDISLRCVDCGRLRYSTMNEAARAGRLRCLACGGLLTESKATEHRNEVLAHLRYGASLLDASKDIPCPSCPAMFRTGVALKLHREERHGAVKKVDPNWN